MLRTRIIYILSLVILGVLIAGAVSRPMVISGEYSEMQREHLIKVGDQWIIKFDIINHEGKDTSYTIKVVVDGKQYNQPVLIKSGGTFTAIHHIYPDKLTNGEVSFAVYKEGEETPIEQATYYLK